MSKYEDDAVLVAAFASTRVLEPTDSEVAAVLERVAQRRQRFAAQPRPLARVRIGGLFAASGAALAIAIAVAAIVLVGHGRPTSAPRATAPVPASARGLVSQLAVLRRPQTAADRAVPWSAASVEQRRWRSQRGEPIQSFDQPVPTLTRRVFTFPNGRGLFMVVLANPTATGAPPPLPARLGDGVALWTLCCNGVGEPSAWLRGHPQLLPEERGIPHSTAVYYAYSVVPDGVARVKWVFAGLHTRSRTWPPATTWAKVQNNVAVAKVVPFPLPVLSATWYAADGRVIASQSWTQNLRHCEKHSRSCAYYG
jgi:hypothetical protein